MKIRVQLYAVLAKYLPPQTDGNTAWLELPEGVSVKEVLQHLKVPEAMPKILLVNGRHAELDKVLSEGDTLSIFPPIAGGSPSGDIEGLTKGQRPFPCGLRD